MNKTYTITLSLDHITEQPYESILPFTDKDLTLCQSFAGEIDLRNTVQVLQYGSLAQKHMQDFASSSLRALPSAEEEQIAQDLGKLQKALHSFDTSITKQEEAFRILYDRMENKLNEADRRLEIHQDSLLRHIHVLDQSYAKLLVILKEYELYLKAGEIAAEHFRSQALPHPENEETDAYAVKDCRNALARFERKLQDLQVSRQIPLHTLAQIRVLQNNDAQMTENLRRLRSDAFPLWKERMILTESLAKAGQRIDFTAIKEGNALLQQAVNALLKLQEEAIEDRKKILLVLNRT